MADKHTKEARSHNMSRVKGKNTKPELIVRKFLFSKGFRFRIHDKKLPGKPDIILPKYKTVVFVNGCFWHGHENCRFATLPKTRTEWWQTKINKNKTHDAVVYKSLADVGWNVMVIWGCDLKNRTVAQTLTALASDIQKKSAPISRC
jgi:DNA mismatch endonuclease (patch repair protein)